MQPLIVRTDPDVQIADRCRDELEALGQLFTCDDDREATILAAVPNAEIILTCYAPITRRIMEAAPRLKGIVKYGVGVDSIDQQAAAERGVYVVNCPDYGTETVADHAFTLLAALARKLPTISRKMRDEGWTWPTDEVLATDVYGKTLGLVGFGRIARAVARRGQGFGMEVLAADPYVDASIFSRANVPQVPLNLLLRRSDFVSLHCVLTDETHSLLGATELRSMKPTAFLINVSRGALVDQPALQRALSERWIAGGGFDVFSDEPLTTDYPLAGMDNVILTPHLAWYTSEALARLDADTLQAVREILAGVPPRKLKNGELLARHAPKLATT